VLASLARLGYVTTEDGKRFRYGEWREGLMAPMKRQAAPTSDVITRLDRVIQYAAAVRLRRTGSGILDRPVKPSDDEFAG
jgi:hypothetical protein